MASWLHHKIPSGMAKTILQGTVKGTRMRGRQKKRWQENIKEWTGMGFGDFLREAEDREGWKGIVATPSVVPRRPPRCQKGLRKNAMSFCMGKSKTMDFSETTVVYDIKVDRCS